MRPRSLWGGSGAASLGLIGAVDNPSYDALFGPGGARDPDSGQRLVAAKRPGMELVIAAHKSVAELGVLGRAEDMHAIMDAERDATLAYLDELTAERGGRRGVAAVPTADRRARLRRMPATPRPGPVTRPPRPRAHRQRDRDARREGRDQGPRHDAVA